MNPPLRVLVRRLACRPPALGLLVISMAPATALATGGYSDADPLWFWFVFGVVASCLGTAGLLLCWPLEAERVHCDMCGEPMTTHGRWVQTSQSWYGQCADGTCWMKPRRGER